MSGPVGRAVAALWLLLAVTGPTVAQPPADLPLARFSSAAPGDGLPPGWQPLGFSRIARQTAYSLQQDAGTVVVKAVSDRSASGLVHALSIDPAAYPLIEWRWKVNNILQKGAVGSKAGDDYPARIYISFAFDPARAGYLQRLAHEAARLLRGPDVPYRAISYVWGSSSPAGTMVANAYTDRVMMFVVQSGDANLHQWVTQTRNVREDYRKAFGEEPTTISGVAIMTDTDDTQESAVAWYGDIVFHAQQSGNE